MTRPTQHDRLCEICSPKETGQDSGPVCPSCGVKTSDASLLKEHLEDGKMMPLKRRRGLYDDGDREEEELPWRIYPREYHDDMSQLLYKTWMHGYKDVNEEEVNDDGGYSQDQVCTATRS